MYFGTKVNLFAIHINLHAAQAETKAYWSKYLHKVCIVTHLQNQLNKIGMISPSYLTHKLYHFSTYVRFAIRYFEHRCPKILIVRNKAYHFVVLF